MPDIDSTSGSLHSEFVRQLFLQAHRETDRFFTASGVQLPEHDRGQFHYLHSPFFHIINKQISSLVFLSVISRWGKTKTVPNARSPSKTTIRPPPPRIAKIQDFSNKLGRFDNDTEIVIFGTVLIVIWYRGNLTFQK